jgi:hypothetical protein
MKKQRRKIKKESDTRFPKVKDQPPIEGNIYED